MTDAHSRDKAPKSRVDDFLFTILGKIKFAVDFAIANDAFLLIPGDLLHQKKPHLISHFLTNKLIELFEPLGNKRIFMVRGNHETFTCDSSLDKSPLGTLVRSGVLTLLNGEAHKVTTDCWVNGYAWTDEREVIPKLFQLSFPESPKHYWNIGLYHQYLIPDGIPFASPHVRFKDTVQYLPQISICGHFHEGFQSGAVRYGEKFLVNPGALARCKANKMNLTRKLFIGFLVLSADRKVLYRNVPIPFESAELVFDLERKAKIAPEKAKLEQFVRQFASDISSMEDLDLDSIDDLLDLVKTLNLRPPVEKVVVRLLEEAKG